MTLTAATAAERLARRHPGGVVGVLDADVGSLDADAVAAAFAERTAVPPEIGCGVGPGPPDFLRALAGPSRGTG